MAAFRLAHGWRLAQPASLSEEDVRGYIRPAVRAIPRALSRSFKPCLLVFLKQIQGGSAASRWKASSGFITIEVATQDVHAHDAALELLTCAGQAAWEASGPARREEWLLLLRGEIERGVEGEIDESALREKRRLFSGPASARSARRLDAYARASFAGSIAEYTHALWHDVHVRSGPDFLPPAELRLRFETLLRWFPPNAGYKLFA